MLSRKERDFFFMVRIVRCSHRNMMITLCFTSLSMLFKAYRDDERVTMKGSAMLYVQAGAKFQRWDPKSGTLSTRPPRTSLTEMFGSVREPSGSPVFNGLE